MATNNFDSGSEDDFYVIFNVVSVLPTKYDYVIEVTKPMDYDEEEMAKQKHVCYFVINNGCIEDQNAFFERQDEGIKNHLKPLFIRSKVKNTTVNKILIDGRVVVNLIPHFLLRKIGKYDTDMRTHNMVLSNYKDKIGHTLGVIQVDMIVK